MNVVDWLHTCEGVTEVNAVTLAIGNETWEGARYKQRGEYHYYLLGKLPKWYGKGRKTCCRFGEDGRDWYVAGYMQKADELAEHQKKYHPFGNHWMLMAWNAPGKIDDHENMYRRLPVDVEVYA